MNTQVTASYLYRTKTNEDGMAAFVYANSKSGFNVVLRDMDADQAVPVVSTYQTLERAKAESDKLVEEIVDADFNEFDGEPK